ncbi:helix-turn-helix domain-containing protein [Paenibacillus marinisediminis]
MAELTGLSITIIGEMERGNRTVHEHALHQIAQAMQVSVQELLDSK